MDTDVEVLRPLDLLLNNKMFIGFERSSGVNPGLMMGSIPGTDLIKTILDQYMKLDFICKDGSLNLDTVVKYTTEVLVEKGLELTGELQCVDGMVVYPKDYFCPYDYENNRMVITPNTYSIHHFSGCRLS